MAAVSLVMVPPAVVRVVAVCPPQHALRVISHNSAVICIHHYQPHHIPHPSSLRRFIMQTLSPQRQDRPRPGSMHALIMLDQGAQKIIIIISLNLSSYLPFLLQVFNSLNSHILSAVFFRCSVVCFLLRKNRIKRIPFSTLSGTLFLVIVGGILFVLLRKK